MWKQIVVLAGVMGCQVVARPCAIIDFEASPPSSTVTESAIIIWDKEKQEEHFIRQASFSTKNKNFGFLVPTPSQPKLVSIEENAFDALFTETLPKKVTKTRWHWNMSSWLAQRNRQTFNTAAASIDTSIGGPAARAASDGGVEMLDKLKLGDYDVAVLKSQDAEALGRWLKGHGYVSNKALMDWVKPYTQKGWILTAFKVARQDRSQTAILPAVRMSFKTNQPIYPYREPVRKTTTQGTSRDLRVYFLSDERMQGSLGEAALGQHWPGETEWTDNISKRAVSGVSEALYLPEASVRQNSRMTVFNDKSSPRPAHSDVYFSPDADQSSITPPPIIRWKDRTIWIPTELAVLGVFGVVFFATRRMQNATSRA